MIKTQIIIATHLLLSLFIATLCNAQVSIHGTVIDGNGQPLDNASVLLLNAKDSSLVKGCMTAKNGTYTFDKIAASSYLIASSFSGFKDAYSILFEVDKKNVAMAALKIVEKVTLLDDVTVSVKKPMFEQHIDRMVINVASSITSAGSTALEVLMRSPGVTVNQQNNTIAMNGKSGVVIMLNGKINRMPIDALVQMLAGMSSANIEKIELITTPPANFDAEGNAGFINIVLKKDTQYGTNGSFSVTGGYGIEGRSVYGGSMNFNYRKAKWNLYGDYSFNRTTPNSYITFYRKVINRSKTIENFMTTDRDDFRRNHNGRLGLDYQLSTKTVVGVLLSGFNNMYGMDAVNTTHILVNEAPV